MTRTETKQFQYEIQTHQEDCVNNIVSLFESLRQKINFIEVMTEHHKNEPFKISFKERINKTQLAALIMEK